MNTRLGVRNYKDCDGFLDLFENKSTPSPDNNLLLESIREDLYFTISSIDEREADIVKLWFGIGVPYELTYEELGAKWTLSRERIRQLKEKAIRRLRHTKRSKFLKNNLEGSEIYYKSWGKRVDNSNFLENSSPSKKSEEVSSSSGIRITGEVKALIMARLNNEHPYSKAKYDSVYNNLKRK